MTGATGDKKRLYYLLEAVHPNLGPGSRYGGTTAHLLFEVADGIFVSIGEKVEDAVFDVVLL